MKYEVLAELYEKLSGTTKGLEKTRILAGFLSRVVKEPEVMYLIQGRFFADYDNQETGISEQIAAKAIAKATGAKDSEVVKHFKKLGDLGKAVEELVVGKKQTSLFSSKLTTEKVLTNLKKMPTLEGKGTVDKKVDLIVELLHAASPVEAKYIIRTVMGDLKIGIGSGIIRDAIVEHCFAPKDLEEKNNYREQVQSAYDISTDFGETFEKACSNRLNSVSLSPGKPLKVMLYPKADNIEDAFSIVGKPAAFEFKYDGFRMMINKDEKGEFRIFTRRLENVTVQFPDALKCAKEHVKAKTFIIDCEAVGYNPKTKKYTPFQHISQRIRRKYDIEKLEKELPIELSVFDILYYDGKSLLGTGFMERRKILEKIIRPVDKKIVLAKQIITDNEDVAEKFFESALDDGQEGLMGKSLSAPYKPGARVGYGVKIKPEARDFDLVITGAEWGTGKRAGWLTSFDVSCRDEESGELLEIGRASTGLKEKEEEGLSFVEMTRKLKPLVTSESGKHLQVKPEVVVTVRYQNVQKSPTYTSGFALRFPRIIAFRPDRGVSDIATLGEIKKEAKKG